MFGSAIHPTPDEQLILNIAAGDRDAFAEVYLRQKGAVYGFALSMLHDAPAAEDVLQETFLQLWSAAASYQPRGQSPVSWLLGITRNTALKHLRTQQRDTAVPLDEVPDAADPLDAFLAAENRIVTRAVMSRLSEEERQIVVLHAVAGMKHREIAKLLDKPLSTVLNKYRRALKKLESLLGEQV